MADFKIKPAAGTGNKLILESEDGTDVLTTSDSSATLADGIALGTPASGVATNITGISAANISGVLPVGVTGGSGLNAVPIHSGSAQLIGIGWVNGWNAASTYVTLENNKTYHCWADNMKNSGTVYQIIEYWTATVNGSGTVTLVNKTGIDGDLNLESTTNAVRVALDSSTEVGYGILFVYEQSSTGTFDTS